MKARQGSDDTGSKSYLFSRERLITCRVHYADMGGRWLQGSLRYMTGLVIGRSDDVLQLEEPAAATKPCDAHAGSSDGESGVREVTAERRASGNRVGKRGSILTKRSS